MLEKRDRQTFGLIFLIQFFCLKCESESVNIVYILTQAKFSFEYLSVK